MAKIYALRKKLVSIWIISLMLLIVIYTEPLWSRYPGGCWIPIIFLLTLIGFIWLVVRLIKEVNLIIKTLNSFKWNQLLPAICITCVLGFALLNTFSFNLDELVYGKVIFRACYEGTQNQATFKLRYGNKFEIHATGIFFYDKYFTGRYTQRGDTLDLYYDGDVHGAVGERVFMNNQISVIEVIERNTDTTRRPLRFYYGYCQGLN